MPLNVSFCPYCIQYAGKYHKDSGEIKGKLSSDRSVHRCFRRREKGPLATDKVRQQAFFGRDLITESSSRELGKGSGNEETLLRWVFSVKIDPGLVEAEGL